MRREAAVVLAVAVVVLLTGQVLSYYASPSEFSMSSETEDGTADYTVKSTFDAEYAEIHLRGTADAPSKFVFLRDDGYVMPYGGTSEGPTCYFLEDSFGRFGNISMSYGTADEILEMMTADLSDGTFDTGLVLLGGALPSVWYDGTPGSTVIQWLAAGGYICWAGDLFGRYISTPEGLTAVADYHTSVCSQLFGAENLFNDAESDVSATVRIDTELTGLAGMYYANVRNGIDVSKLSVPHTVLGYTDGQYCSNAAVRMGSGTLCLFGGSVGYQMTEYLVHELFLGISYDTEVVSSDTGSMKDGSHSGSFDVAPGVSDFVVLRDVRWYRGWAYDTSSGSFT